MNASNKEIRQNVEKRRTFGIISHPDAGKTTLTEKLLLFGGAINMAGTVKSRKAARHATSDWMKMEQERGISVTTSVMKFEYKGYDINLLDTPGHEDFSEDTYRVLTAVDSALLVIDSAKGVEAQTKKLMDVCRMRKTPIMSFINKLDRDGLDPLDVLADIEDHLGIECAPLSWPIGMGKDFKGTYSIYNKRIHLFSATHGGRIQQGVVIEDVNDPKLDELLGRQAEDLRRDLELLEGAGNPFPWNATWQGPRPRSSSAAPSTTSAFRRCSTPLSSSPPAPVRAPRRPERSRPSRMNSRAWSSKSRRTWTRLTETASPSCASAPASTPRA